MKNTEMKLAKYINESKKARNVLSEKLQQPLTDLELQIALGHALGYEADSSTRVIEHEMTAEQMLKILADYKFNFPELIATIEFHDTILPDNVPRRMDEQEIKHKGEIWVIHKNDADPWPSNPHAHNMEQGYKLHLGNGDLYDYKNQPLKKKISKKYLLAIREKAGKIALPALTV
jgi:hypothetical protein